MIILIFWIAVVLVILYAFQLVWVYSRLFDNVCHFESRRYFLWSHVPFLPPIIDFIKGVRTEYNKLLQWEKRNENL